jgi:hypothetical protein
MWWMVTFNDGSKITVSATWIIEAIVEACIKTDHSYTDAVDAAHILEWKG